jgi:hypothetical protein
MTSKRPHQYLSMGTVMYAIHIKPRFKRIYWDKLPTHVRSDFQMANLLNTIRAYSRNGFQIYVCMDHLYIVNAQDTWYVGQFQTK